MVVLTYCFIEAGGAGETDRDALVGKGYIIGTVVEVLFGMGLGNTSIPKILTPASRGRPFRCGEAHDRYVGDIIAACAVAVEVKNRFVQRE